MSDINELSSDLLLRYLKKAPSRAMDTAYQAGKFYKKADSDDYKEPFNKTKKRVKFMKKAVDRLTLDNDIKNIVGSLKKKPHYKMKDGKMQTEAETKETGLSKKTLDSYITKMLSKRVQMYIDGKVGSDMMMHHFKKVKVAQDKIDKKHATEIKKIFGESLQAKINEEDNIRIEKELTGRIHHINGKEIKHEKHHVHINDENIGNVENYISSSEKVSGKNKYQSSKSKIKWYTNPKQYEGKKYQGGVMGLPDKKYAIDMLIRNHKSLNENIKAGKWYEDNEINDDHIKKLADEYINSGIYKVRHLKNNKISFWSNLDSLNPKLHKAEGERIQGSQDKNQFNKDLEAKRAGEELDRRKKLQEDFPTNSMGASSSTSGPIQTFDPLLFTQERKKKVMTIMAKRRKEQGL